MEIIPERYLQQMDDDIQLMLRIRDGDHHAFTELRCRYIPYLKRFFAGLGCPGSVREDLVQEVFSRVWNKREEYQPTSTVKSFLRGFASNIWCEHCYHSQHQSAVYQQIGMVRNSYNPSSDPVVLQYRELAEAFKQTKTRLPDKQRQAVELVLESGLSHSEAAKRAGCSYSAFRQRFHDAKKQLRILLGPSHAL